MGKKELVKTDDGSSKTKKVKKKDLSKNCVSIKNQKTLQRILPLQLTVKSFERKKIGKPVHEFAQYAQGGLEVTFPEWWLVICRVNVPWILSSCGSSSSSCGSGGGRGFFSRSMGKPHFGCSLSGSSEH